MIVKAFFRKISANDLNLKEFFRINQDKINSSFPGKNDSGIFLCIQSSIVDGSENPCVAGSIPVLATLFIVSSEFLICLLHVGSRLG